MQAWEMDQHGAYQRVSPEGHAGINAQQVLLERLASAQPT
jgi:hypothetical protein